MFAKSGLMTAPCGVPSSGFDHAPIFEHACRQPFGNQPDDSPVANPMLGLLSDRVSGGGRFSRRTNERRVDATLAFVNEARFHATRRRIQSPTRLQHPIRIPRPYSAVRPGSHSLIGATGPLLNDEDSDEDSYA
jgi:hypothetical protein